jgi:hypothetical protein
MKMAEAGTPVALGSTEGLGPTALEKTRLRAISDEYAALMLRWKDAQPYTQEIADLHATFKASDRTAGEAFGRGEVGRLLDENKQLRAMLTKARAGLSGGLWDYGPGQCEHEQCNVLLAEIDGALGPNE